MLLFFVLLLMVYTSFKIPILMTSDLLIVNRKWHEISDITKVTSKHHVIC